MENSPQVERSGYLRRMPPPTCGRSCVKEINMKEIELSQNRVALVDDSDLEWLSAWKWCFDGRYAVRREKKSGNKLYMHRQILRISHGEITDHINQKSLDNRRCNLRVVTTAQNGMNRSNSRNHSSCYKGVHLETWTGRWRAQIKAGNKNIRLGRFDSEIEAARAYDRAALEHFGEFASLNNV